VLASELMAPEELSAIGFKADAAPLQIKRDTGRKEQAGFISGMSRVEHLERRRESTQQPPQQER